MGILHALTLNSFPLKCCLIKKKPWNCISSYCFILVRNKFSMHSSNFFWKYSKHCMVIIREICGSYHIFRFFTDSFYGLLPKQVFFLTYLLQTCTFIQISKVLRFSLIRMKLNYLYFWELMQNVARKLELITRIASVCTSLIGKNGFCTDDPGFFHG